MEFYNKHYIRCREDGCVVDGFSDAFREPTDTDICINWMGGYQFRLIYVEHDETKNAPVRRMTEENPSLFDWNGMIPLYRWTEEEYIAKRTEEEIEAERAALPVPEVVPTETERLRADLDFLAIMTGVEL